MAWPGYGLVAGNEVYNSARTSAYVKNGGGGSWFQDAHQDEFLPLMLGERPYRTPLLDNAPWTEADHPESYDFWGLYPLDQTGIEDSSRNATVTESTLTGGVPGRIRHATKSVVFNGILLGATEAGVEYGMRWLRRVLLPGPCGGPDVANCLGDDFCYLSAPPCLDSLEGDEFPSDCLDSSWRTLKKFAVINGPHITSKRTLSDGCATMWSVTFTGVAGNPWEYGQEVPVIRGFTDPQLVNPFVSDVVGYYDLHSTLVSDNCAVQVWQPLVDPMCPMLIPPPGPTKVPLKLGCYDPPTNWARRAITIPEEYIPLWDSVAPVIDVHAVNSTLRNLRVRFYANPFSGDDAIVDDNCAYCGDIVISYVPQGYTLTFDGAEERVFATAPGGQQMRADSLVFATDGTPFIWPELSCGFGYVVTFDLPQTQVPPVIDLSLVPRSA